MSEPPPSTIPKKYITVNGVMKLNPAYTQWTQARSSITKPVTTVPEPEIALPIVSTMDDYHQMVEAQAAAAVVVVPATAVIVDDNNNNNKDDVDIPVLPFTDLTAQAMNTLQEPEICIVAGLQPDNALDELTNMFAKYEVPIGMMNKLLCVQEYDSLEFIIDDSGSMRAKSDTKNASGHYQTRWEEACQRLKQLLEVLAYLPMKQVGIEFLNRSHRIALTHHDKSPQVFLNDAYAQIDAVFADLPMGTTPALEKLTHSLNSHNNNSGNVARYFFGDGVPNGGKAAQERIVSLLKHRTNPAGNPITFISCTNDDDAVEWMKDAEEVVPYCSESDDFQDESREVMKDQGKALPYSRGFHLIATLVAAMHPHDLDAMDESVPFTKATLDDILGIVANDETYQHYFHHFVMAQHSRRILDYNVDTLKAKTKWNYEEFKMAKVAKDIPKVREFQQKLQQQAARSAGGQHQQQYARGGTTAQQQPGVDAECCVIL